MSLFGACKSCGAPRQRVQVKSDASPNKGDWFYSCPQGQHNELCKKSFEWEDKAKHPDKFPRRTPFAPASSAAQAPTGAVAPGLLTEATGQEILKKLDFIAAQLTPPGCTVQGTNDAMSS